MTLSSAGQSIVMRRNDAAPGVPGAMLDAVDGPSLQLDDSGRVAFQCSLVNGGVTGAGVILISILMSVGLAGSTLVATDAIVSVIMGLTKVLLFGGLAALNLDLALLGLLIGLFTAPGAFIARALLKLIPAGVHAWMMELVVVIGAVVLILRS